MVLKEHCQMTPILCITSCTSNNATKHIQTGHALIVIKYWCQVNLVSCVTISYTSNNGIKHMQTGHALILVKKRCQVNLISYVTISHTATFLNNAIKHIQTRHHTDSTQKMVPDDPHIIWSYHSLSHSLVMPKSYTNKEYTDSAWKMLHDDHHIMYDHHWLHTDCIQKIISQNIWSPTGIHGRVQYSAALTVWEKCFQMIPILYVTAHFMYILSQPLKNTSKWYPYCVLQFKSPALDSVRKMLLNDVYIVCGMSQFMSQTLSHPLLV
jgi:hypothetical protein